MNLTDTKPNGRHCTHQTTMPDLKIKRNFYWISTTKKSNNCLPKLPSAKESQVLNLKKKLFILTHPDKLPNYEAMNSHLKEIISLHQQIEQLESDLNNTPTTVGDYYEQLNKK